jgi:SAM-dependent methyltransferase
VVSHEERARSFGRQAERYERLRPGYPAAAVRAILPHDRQRVADVGAGTGKLSAALAAAGHTVVAVEPDPLMRATLTARIPDVEALSGRSEALPLPDNDVDAVLFGQSWHWTEPDVAAAEARRVLRAGGVLAMLWNIPDATASWVRTLVSHTHPGQDPDPDHFPDPPTLAGFRPGSVLRTAWTQALAAPEVAELVGTWSRVSTRAPAERDDLLRAVRDLVRTHPDLAGRTEIGFPYVCVAYRYQVADGPAATTAPRRG